MFVVSNAVRDGKPIGLKRAGEGFHTDGEDKPIPNAGSFLYALEVPPERGDTLFVDMYAVHDTLPAEIKRRIAGRRARFSRIALHNVHYPLLPPLTEEQKRERPDVYHPLLRRHPRSGRTSLYIGRWACDIEGMPQDEGRELIAYLQNFAQQRQFIYRHVWRVGDAALWDNRCTQHCATGFDDEKYVRIMQRTTLEGEVPKWPCPNPRRRDRSLAMTSRRTVLKGAAAGLATPFVISARAAETLVVTAYGGEYETVFRQSTLDPFAKKFGVKIVYAESGGAAQTYTKIRATRGAPGFDVAAELTPPEAILGAREKLLEPVTEREVPNLKYVWKKSLTAIPPSGW